LKINEQSFDYNKIENKSLYRRLSSKVSGKTKRKLIILIILLIFLVLVILLILKKTGHLDLFHKKNKNDIEDELPSIVKKDKKIIKK